MFFTQRLVQLDSFWIEKVINKLLVELKGAAAKLTAEDNLQSMYKFFEKKRNLI